MWLLQKAKARIRELEEAERYRNRPEPARMPSPEELADRAARHKADAEARAAEEKKRAKDAASMKQWVEGLLAGRPGEQPPGDGDQEAGSEDGKNKAPASAGKKLREGARSRERDGRPGTGSSTGSRGRSRSNSRTR